MRHPVSAVEGSGPIDNDAPPDGTGSSHETSNSASDRRSSSRAGRKRVGVEHVATTTLQRLVALLVAVLLAGCGTAPDGTVAQPQFDGGEDAMTASMDGILAGDADRDGGCVWLEEPDGTVSAIAWAFPVLLRTEDMALVDQDGDVLAEVGDHVRLGGGQAHGETMDRCMVSDRLVQAWTLDVEDAG